MKKRILLLVSIALLLSSFAMPHDIWKMLAGLGLKTHFNEKTERFDFELIPTEEIKNLDGKMIEIKGFVIRDGRHSFVLSRYSKLFKCDFPKIESILRIKTKRRIVTNPEKPCTIKGRFEFNTTDLLELPYILNEAECLDCEK